MESSAFSQIGRYGTISLMKRNESDAVVTSFGIDTEQLTFGRDPSCSVRLYYPDISLIHCKIIFEERKAFLIVLGAKGLLIDGCEVFPSSSSTSPNTIPLSNNSEIEIHNKRFRFSYPPKELRAQLYATPARPNRRALRLSMIHSAHVFSPRPSKDPMENLRVLQSPLKPMKSRTPSPHVSDHDEDEEDIILVQGSHPRVVEEEKDLVILEDVEVSQPKPVLPLYVPPPRPETPQRKVARPSLHRAVLIRSAHRAVMKAEIEREDEEEEMEVFGAVLGDNADDDDDESEEEEGQENEEPEEDASDEGEEEEEPSAETIQAQKATWRKSLERIWPFGVGGGETANKEPAKEQSESDLKEEEEAEEHLPPASSTAMATPPRHQFTSRPFMTPQVRSNATAAAGRFSLGGGEARRVVVEQPWRVKDIVVPAPGARAAPSTPAKPVFGSPVVRGVGRGAGRDTISEEERKAIQERRRSAIKTPNAFFAGGAPGMSPTKTRPVLQNSPEKVQKEEPEHHDDDDDDQVDTRDLLERMKKTVEGMKRRSSIAPRHGANLGLASGMMGDIEETEEQPASQPEHEDIEMAMDVDPAVVVHTQVASTPMYEYTDTMVPVHGDEEEEEELLQPKKAAPKRGRKKLNLPAIKETPSLADDEASPGDFDVRVGDVSDEEEQQPPKARLLRRKANEATETGASSSRSKKIEVDTSATKRSTRTRATPTPEPPEVSMDSGTSLTKPRAGRKKAAVPAVHDNNEDAATEAHAPKRGRKAGSVPPADLDVDIPAPVVVKPVRRSRLPKKAATDDETATSSADPEASARASEIDVDVDQPVAKVRKPRATKKVIKEEEATELPEEPSKPTRRRKVNQTATETAVPARSRGKKAAADVTPISVAVDKENAPGSGSTSASEEETVKTKAPPKAKRTVAAKVKREVASEPEIRVTRATRARTRTKE